MRILLVDNYDSYTFNLFQLLAVVAGSPPQVLANDAPQWRELDLADFAAAVVSPGPGRPQRPRDVGRAPELLEQAGLPVLGVCLGHQLIAHSAGAEVQLAPAPRHGHLTRVCHWGSDVFADLPQGFTAVRYHSLAATAPLPSGLQATAWAEDGVIMGLRHRSRPYWGVQFHPESIASEHGHALIANFLDLAANARTARRKPRSPQPAAPAAQEPRNAATPAAESTGPGSGDAIATCGSAGFGGDVLEWRALPGALDTERVFCALYSDDARAFWLDSSRIEDTGRFSFLGAPSGPRAESLHYRLGEGAVEVRGPSGAHREEGTIFDVLQRRTAPRPAPPPAGLPFDFTGGYVGYFGYGLKADCGAAAAHRATTPDAVWLRIDRFIAVDHVEGRTYVVARAPSAQAEQARHWVGQTCARLADLPPAPPLARQPTPRPAAAEAHLACTREDYLAAVKECLGYLAAGESYELCLTTQARLPAPDDELAFYRRLRRANPAPYGALLRLGELSVHSSSPERFLRIGPDATAESRPIKGTAPRAADPEADAVLARALRAQAKTRAENLMIVDLLRNDLGRVCEVGSVAVPQFMYTRTYATVHQLVSTVAGTLRGDVHPVRAVQACFPGGSMTGAPKLRTMELLDGLEAQARGVYSGALGYIGYDGTADLSIVIRTAVRHGGELHIGAGGAIVLDSDPEEEYQEMLLKAAVPLRGFA